ncbi:hypothetical protein [Castellaniella sp.]|uniref:hypothetical protein n=1 Tax=Castellaniella sp. TaxID=1955812 RepID=UPI002AFF95D9|nr:hypothetical protein [Castellaniella sp.]
MDFSDWRHYGDNPVADGVLPGRLGITPVLHSIPRFNEYERSLVRDLGSYDAYCIATLMARYRFDHEPSTAQEFAYTRVSLYLVSYVLWVLSDAVNRGIENLYFISRDGHHLKRIADAVIKEQNLGIATHYLYGSRKVWWIASFVDHIDAEFFLGLESLKESCRFSDILDSLSLDARAFHRIFPQFPEWSQRTRLPLPDVKSIVQAAKASKAYENHILELARSRRPMVCQYLRESVDLEKRSAFVEYWGRGFTQTCFGRLLACAHETPLSTEFYYARSIYQSDATGVRRNFTVSKSSLLPVERLFANFPRSTVTAYERGDMGKTQAVTYPRQHDEALFSAMEALLPQFALDLCRAGLFDKADTLRRVFDWSIGRFSTDLSDRVVWEPFARLKYVNRSFGEETEFAPAFGLRALWQALLGRKPESESVEISLKRSVWLIRMAYSVVFSLRRHKSL